MWSNWGMKSTFMGITGHYISKEGKLTKVFLGLQLMEEEVKNAEAVRDSMKKILKLYGLHLLDIKHIITDSGSNIVAAFKNCFTRKL
jgi:hypothetical protein